MYDHERQIDKWLKYTAVIGPLTTFILGIGTGTWGTYKALQSDGYRIEQITEKIGRLEGWKEHQDDFNQKTVAAIARLQALMKDSQP